MGKAGYNNCDRQRVTYISGKASTCGIAIDGEEKDFAVRTMVLASNQDRLNNTMQ